MSWFRFWVVAAGLLCAATSALAESALDYFTDSSGKYAGPTLEDQVAMMDTDHNGFADVFEVRTYLEKQHGKGYEKELLDKWESSASGKSCSTPFAKQLYGDSVR
ncbi:hypothetical protein [Methylophilus aquaticus]|uniref:EF-hand domain-containing protein n=1 Tax=Methylophilus aquaticus TaxID=1971610 RepID=A0ABT9JUC3_9PROT|nr:hypothetical protein [Methylophilus aquaticus]MDP8568162.1 hypothetical protein [Methylophilus aquaticus]